MWLRLRIYWWGIRHRNTTWEIDKIFRTIKCNGCGDIFVR